MTPMLRKASAGSIARLHSMSDARGFRCCCCIEKISFCLRRGCARSGFSSGYCVSLSTSKGQKVDREFELTDREIECLFWIAEGKTSDEIAVILGISRNTINNYITSVMRKTATKTRSEAIAYAVRNNLV